MAGLNACTNGCMSVLDRSCFSYQVAAGRTTSAYSVVEVIRKSSASSRSSLPSGASARQVTSRGRWPSGASAARTELDAPSRCLRKYSLPLPEEPSRFARHTVRTRGKFSGASGSSAANRSRPAASSPVTNAPGSPPDASSASARSRGFQLKVGYDGIQPSRADCASRSAVVIPANLPLAGRRGERACAERVVAPLVGGHVPVGGPDHLPRRPLPVRRHRQRGVAGDRAHLLLAHVVRPAAAVASLAAGHRHQGQERPVDRVGVEVVVGPGAHDDHGTAAGLLGVPAELPADPLRGRGRDAGDGLLPGRGARLLRIGIRRGPVARQAVPAHAVLGQQQVEHRGDQAARDPPGRHAAADHPRRPVVGVEPGQVHRDGFRIRPVHGQHRRDVTEVQVPPALASGAEPEPERPAGNGRLPGPAVQHDGLEVGVLGVLAQRVGGQELARLDARPRMARA